MASQVSAAPADRDNRDADYNFLPDFAWAAVGGCVVLAGCAVLLMLTVTWGGLQAGAATPGGGSASLSTYARELAGGFLAGFLVVLVARSLSTRTR